ncbi:MAG TPA: zinc metalloprotease [Flavobacteriaceae bacterium]|nr:zinc metalloprotease [Flavobacteriaceae bacterium]
MSDFRVYTDVNVDEASKSSDNSKLNAHRTCYTMQNLNRLLNENPGLERRMYNIEYQTREFIASKKPTGVGGGNGGNHGGGNGGGTTDPPTDNLGVITIPVVINIIEKYDHQVTDNQITSQLSILNKDYNNSNPNTLSVPGEFSSLVADFNINFTLGSVNRKISTKSSWGTSDAMKFSSEGGIDATDPSTNLNVWVCEIGGGILGYAQFPGGPEATDGVVIGPNYFGETSGPYGQGRTATHEIGHWLNLRHIWGDGRCKQDDFVADTPSSDRPNYGCPSYPTVHCRSTDMTMNYMDYTDDNCMYMFTNGQSDRARAIFLSGGPRAAMAGN